MSELQSRDSEFATTVDRIFALGESVDSVADGSSASWTRLNLPPARSAQGRLAGPRQLFRYRVLKRAIDIAVIVIFSPVLLLLVAVIAAAVRLSSPGPIFFSHRRIQRHGSFFSMWKFRTMCANSSEVLEAYLARDPAARVEWRRTHKLKRDPRVTRVGEFLRKTSLDELPQVWNVFTGTMSLVGPRPIVAAEVEKYGEFFADYCLVKPGITGLWQVSGRSSCTYGQRVQLDRQYAQTWSLRGDCIILVKTLSAVFNQDGAY
jgi:lipopolysaccharide/colanic/teichoic acid biosynthesis glycosyltransferase